MKTLRHSLVQSILAAIALCGSAGFCYASVEPELTTAIRHRNTQYVMTLLSEGVNVNETDEGPQQTPLMWAVRTGSLNIVQGLLNHGAAVNARDAFGSSALSLALRSGNTKIVQLLKSHGARTVAAGPPRHARTSGDRTGHALFARTLN